MKVRKSEQRVMSVLLKDCNQPTEITQNAIFFLKKIKQTVCLKSDKIQGKDELFPMSRIRRGS